MNKLTCLIASLAALSPSLIVGQDGAASGRGSAKSEPREEGSPRLQAPPKAESHLTKFNLDFPGGTPKQLVDAIQKAMGGRPLNAVIPVENANWKLPPLKMNGVDVAQLFLALEQASHATSVVSLGNGRVQTGQTQYGFRQAEGRPTEDTVWYFTASGQMEMPKVSRYYYLAPYLDAGLTVDDITTAIQTGWRLRGDAPTPALSFHKETKLLIAVGDNAGLDVIDQVLKALDAVKAKPVAEKSAADPKTRP